MARRKVGTLRALIGRFMVTMTLLLAALYAYVVLPLGLGVAADLALALPFVLVWLVPALYWVGDREGHTRVDDAVHFASYLAMGWLNFAVLLALVRDLLLLGTWALSLPDAHAVVAQHSAALVLGGSLAALGLGMFWGLRGPGRVEVEVPIAGLHPSLEGLRIAQISDLHVGPVIGERYVRHVAELARSLEPDLVALTGDFVDGPVARLAPHLEPLRGLFASAPTYFITGNHEYYSDAAAWLAHFRRLGARTLENEHAAIERGGARLLVAGVNDVTAPRFGAPPPDPQRAIGAGRADLKILLAHNPKIAPQAARAGFDLQLSGHTHGGQFFPWTLAVQRLHAPHVTGLSREGAMSVYVSAGTGSWGPPVRFGTRTEVTLLKLVAAA